MPIQVPCCKFCGGRLRAGQEAICLRMGVHGISTKSGLAFFDPVVYDDNDDHKWFHLPCWLDRFDMSVAETEVEDLFTCVFCPEDLEGEPYFFEMELNHFDKDRHGLFSAPKRDLETGRVPRCYACKECVIEGVGEGNSIRACEILALEADEDDVATKVEDAARFDADLIAARKIKSKINIGPPPKRRAVG